MCKDLNINIFLTKSLTPWFSVGKGWSVHSEFLLHVEEFKYLMV